MAGRSVLIFELVHRFTVSQWWGWGMNEGGGVARGGALGTRGGFDRVALHGHRWKAPRIHDAPWKGNSMQCGAGIFGDAFFSLEFVRSHQFLELQFAAAGHRSAFQRDEQLLFFLRVSWVSLAGCGAGEQEVALAGIAGKGGGAFELDAGFGVAS